MTIIVMMRDILVRIRWHLIDVTGGMDRELNARDASPARSAAWAMPEKLVRTSIRHVRKAKRLALACLYHGRVFMSLH
jgi:hypothetical protein